MAAAVFLPPSGLTNVLGGTLMPYPKGKPSANAIDLVGSPPFGRLTVLGPAGKTKSGKPKWLCRCECGNEKIVIGSDLRGGKTRSCGCLKNELASERMTTHGHARRENRSDEYKIWCGVLERCTNKNGDDYEDYGGRGITVCEGWQESFVAFNEDMGPRPSDGHSVDRKNNDGGYWCGHCDECIANGWPANCRWATSKEQMRNFSRNRMLTFNGETRCLAEWVEVTGISLSAIKRRLSVGWPIERVLTR